MAGGVKRTPQIRLTRSREIKIGPRANKKYSWTDVPIFVAPGEESAAWTRSVNESIARHIRTPSSCYRRRNKYGTGRGAKTSF